jgi:hypothetical protein
MVPRQPLAWRGDWANELAACIDATPCGHDLEEDCVFRVTQRSVSAATCMQGARSRKDQQRCAVLNGLLPGADQWADGCIRSGRSLHECTPPYDWK